MAQIKISSAKAKGRWLQDWVAARIGEMFGVSAGHADDDLIEPRPMGQKGVDVILRGNIARRFPFAIECKSGQSVNWLEAMRQAKANCKEGQEWMVFIKRKEFRTPAVMLDARVFFSICEKNFPG